MSRRIERPGAILRRSEYLKLRGIESGVSKPTFPEVYGVVERDRFYKSCSFAGTGGASGHDAPVISLVHTVYDIHHYCNELYMYAFVCPISIACILNLNRHQDSSS